MKIAALYDIHGNLPALEAVLAEIETLDIDALVIGGDAIGGPLPAKTLECLQQVTVATHFLHGNGESEVLRYLACGVPGGLTPAGDDAARWVAAHLSSAQQEFIGTWQLSVTLNAGQLGEMLFCHANPQNDVTIFTERTPDERVQAVLGEVSAAVVICGHTHMQFDRTIGGVRVVNAGSVGMPFGATGAHWLLIDDDIQLRRTEYDYEHAAERIRASSYPDADAFAKGNILSVPSEETAFGFLNKIEQSQQA